jgi:hypothetical protein
MKKALMLPLLALAAAAAQAGTYSVLQASDCPAVSGAELTKAVRQAGTVTGLDLPKDMALRAELQCSLNGKAKGNERYIYTFRAAIEKQVSDGEQLRWTPVAYHTGFGTAGGSAPMLRQVHFTVRDLVRQEP